MQDYDLTTPQGKQAFQRWVTEIIRNEINSYVEQVLFQRNATNITTPTTSDTNPSTNTTYTAAEIQDFRLERLEQATFRR
jgi:hypothetical protein